QADRRAIDVSMSSTSSNVNINWGAFRKSLKGQKNTHERLYKPTTERSLRRVTLLWDRSALKTSIKVSVYKDIINVIADLLVPCQKPNTFISFLTYVAVKSTNKSLAISTLTTAWKFTRLYYYKITAKKLDSVT